MRNQEQNAASRRTSLEIWKAIEIVARAKKTKAQTIWKNGDYQKLVVSIAQSLNPEESVFFWGCETIEVTPKMKRWTVTTTEEKG